MNVVSYDQIAFKKRIFHNFLINEICTSLLKKIKNIINNSGLQNYYSLFEKMFLLMLTG